MVSQIIFVQNFTFNLYLNLKQNIKQIIDEFLKDKVTYFKIKNTSDLVDIIKNNFDTSKSLIEKTCWYDEKYLITSIVEKDDFESFEKHTLDKILFIKRNINPDDTYLLSDLSSNSYIFQNMKYEYLCDILISKNISKGILVKYDTDILDFDYDHEYLDNNIGSIHYFENSELKEIKYFDHVNIYNDDKIIEKVSEQITNSLDENDSKMNVNDTSFLHIELNKHITEHKVDYMLAQIKTTFGIFNCWYKAFDPHYNPIMSRFLRKDVRGDFFVTFMINNSTTNLDTPLPLTKNIFNKFLDLENSNPTRKNKNFYNVFYEIN